MILLLRLLICVLEESSIYQRRTFFVFLLAKTEATPEGPNRSCAPPEWRNAGRIVARTNSFVKISLNSAPLLRKSFERRRTPEEASAANTMQPPLRALLGGLFPQSHLIRNDAKRRNDEVYVLAEVDLKLGGSFIDLVSVDGSGERLVLQFLLY